MATFNSTSGNDTIIGSAGRDTLVGSLGSDVYDGGDLGPNFLNYGSLSVDLNIVFQSPNRAITTKSGGGTDVLTNINDILGGSGNDQFVGFSDSTGVYTLANGMFFHGGRGNDIVDGQENNLVRAVYWDSPSATNIDLTTGVAKDGWGGTDTLKNVVSVHLSNFNDTVKGGNGGAAGNEWFFAGDNGSHHIDGNARTSSYRYTGSAGIVVDLAANMSAQDGFTGTATKLAGIIDYLQGINDVRTGAGNDFIYGSLQDETFFLGAGNNYAEGRGGLDRVSYLNVASQGVVVNLTTGAATNSSGGHDVLVSIESVNGTNLADNLTGVSVAGQRTFLIGYGGNDTLRAPALGTLITADYSNDTSAVSVNLSLGNATDAYGDHDSLINIRSVRGSAYNDTITGNGQDDWLEGKGGNDVLLGVAGLDNAIFDAARSAYNLSMTTTNGTVTKTATGEIDFLTSIERLLFSDGTLAFDLAGNAGQAYRLYQAAFDRTPDVVGLKFQTKALDAGLTLGQVAGNFIASPEFQSKYGAHGTVSDAQFVTLLYNNVLHRAPELAGYEYHVTNLAFGLERASLLMQFSESPENQTNVLPVIKDGIWLGL